MAALSRKGDVDQPGGQITRGASSVFCNGIAVGLHVSPITPHGKHAHHSAVTTDGSPSVICEGSPVLRVGSGNSCGHSIVQGSPNVNVP
jgi:uncharacterized Zn-binding protein involved in type VI secretion